MASLTEFSLNRLWSRLITNAAQNVGYCTDAPKVNLSRGNRAHSFVQRYERSLIHSCDSFLGRYIEFVHIFLPA